MTNILPDFLSRQADVNPSKVAIQAHNGTYTYLALRDTVGLAAIFLAPSIEPDSRVAVLVQDSLHYALCVHTLIQLEAILVPLNWRLTPTEMAWQVRDSGAEVLIYDALQGSVARNIAEELQENHNQLHMIAVEAMFSASEEVKTQPDLDVRQDLARQRKVIRLDKTQAIIYTSGTTGRPKGAMLTYGNHWWGATASALGLGLDVNDKWLIPMPLFHVGGLAVLMRSLIYGTTAILHTGFDAKAVSHALDEQQVTLVSLVPTMLQRLLDERAAAFPDTLRAILLGGSGTAASLVEASLNRNVPIRQSYGLTEANSQVATIRGEDAARKIGSAGKPLLPTQVTIAVNHQPVSEPNIEGEIWVKGPTVTPGYWNRPDANQESFVEDWFRTGDVGYIDDEGFLFVLDRRSDIIISGGENVYPAEVEAAFEAHPAVEHCGVIGEDDKRWGQSPVAFLVFKEMSIDDPYQSTTFPTDEELLDFVSSRLAKYKIPKRLHRVTSLPRNASGKLLRKNLREWLVNQSH